MAPQRKPEAPPPPPRNRKLRCPRATHPTLLSQPNITVDIVEESSVDTPASPEPESPDHISSGPPLVIQEERTVKVGEQLQDVVITFVWMPEIYEFQEMDTEEDTIEASVLHTLHR